jgi:glycosyltransferase involved in cell wall biosynthesis
MKVIHTIPYFLPAKVFGGPIYSTYYLCKELKERGHEIVLLTTDILTPGERQKDFLKEESIDGIKVKRFKILTNFMSYYFTPEIIKSLLSEKPDIIHAHGYRNFQADAAAICSRLRGIPLVLHPRGMAIPEAAQERGSKIGNLIYRGYDFATMRFTLRLADKIIATTEYEKELLERNNFLRGKLEVVPHGVDAKRFKKNAGDFRDKHDIQGKILLYVGRIDRGKNIEALLRVASQLQSRDLTLVLVGGELASTQIKLGSYKKELIEYSEKLGLENVVFTGGLYDQDLIAAYSAADIFVNPSISRAENFGLVNLEAASCSLPVVAAPVGVAPELLRGHEGLLFNTEEELADILGKLLEDEDLCRKIGGELRKKVEEEYTWSRAAERVEKVYEEILSQ